MLLKKKSKMNIELFEDNNGLMIYDTNLIDEEIEKFYT